MTVRSHSTPVDPKARLFLSYARKDSKRLADRLRVDLESRGYEVWQDSTHIRAAGHWDIQIEDGLRSAQVVIALLSPYAVRQSGHPHSLDDQDSVCLDEISFARFARPPTPIVPVMAEPCEPPFCIFRLEYVDLCTWIESDEKYHAGLGRILEAVEDALDGRVHLAWWESRLKPWDFTAYVFEKRRNFVGRQWLCNEVDSWLRTGSTPALLITGDPGIGKSAFVAELAHSNPDDRVLAYHFCQSQTQATLDPGLFVRSLAAMAASKLKEYSVLLSDPAVDEALREDNCAMDPGSAFERGVLMPLESLHAPESGVRIILIDALDESLLRSSSNVTIVDVLASRLERLPAWLRIVATTRKERQVMERLSGLRATEIEAHDPRNLNDVECYIDSRLRSPELADRVAASHHAVADVRRELRDRSDGNFLYVREVLAGVERDLYSLDELDKVPSGLAGVYLRDFMSRFPGEAEFLPARAILEVAVVAREPLTESLLARATELDQETELQTGLRDLSAYVPGRDGLDGDTKYAIFHRSFADWLTSPDQRGGTYHVSIQRGHERLVRACWSEYKKAPDKLSPYASQHLPNHLIELGRWSALLELATSPLTGYMRRWVEGTEGGQGVTCLLGVIRYLETECPNPVMCAGLATQVARIHSRWGEYDRSTGWLEYALQRTSWRRGRSARAIALHELGSLALYRRAYREAIRYYRRALRLAQWSLPRLPKEAAANYIGLATVNQAQYRFPRTIYFAQRAIRLAKKSGDLPHWIAGERMRGAASKSLGAYSDAERYLQAGVLLARMYGSELELARLLLLAGWLHYDLATLHGEVRGEARKLFTEALAAAKAVRDMYCTVEAQMSLGWCDLRSADPEDSRSLFEALAKALRPKQHHELCAGIELGIAVASHRQGKLDDAQRQYSDAISFCHENGIYRWQYVAEIGLGAAYHLAGRTDDAETRWKEALRIAGKISQAKQVLAKASIEACRIDPTVPP